MCYIVNLFLLVINFSLITAQNAITQQLPLAPTLDPNRRTYIYLYIVSWINLIVLYVRFKFLLMNLVLCYMRFTLFSLQFPHVELT